MTSVVVTFLNKELARVSFHRQIGYHIISIQRAETTRYIHRQLDKNCE